MGKPGGNQLAFLSAHLAAPGKAATATILANAAGYTGWHSLNLQYGLLAKRIGKEMGMPTATLSLLVDFVQPDALTNEHWILVMKPAFAQALVRSNWVSAED